jgi:hypothetical protein
MAASARMVIACPFNSFSCSLTALCSASLEVPGG